MIAAYSCRAATVLYRFRDFTLDIERGCLTRNGTEIGLRPLPFRLLRIFVGKPGRVIAKDELISELWPSTTVTDESLTQCIKDLRKAIQDEERTIIRTLPRRGYLFADTVAQVAPEPNTGAQQPPVHAQSREQVPSVAVLPLENVSGDSAQDYFGRGIAEDIITELSRFSELLVISRNSSFRYAGASPDIQDIGRELGARYVLDGSIRRIGERVRISVQLTDVDTRTSRWAEHYDCSVDDLFAVQDEVVRTIVSVLAAHLNRSEVERARRKPPANWEAYDYYLQGSDTYSMFHRDMTAANIYRSRSLIEQCLALAPDFSPAQVVLSATYTTTYNLPLDDDYLKPEALAKAIGAATIAIKCDPKSPKAHTQLGYVMIFMRQPDRAVALFERAMALNPNFSDWRLALALMMAGHMNKAVDVAQSHLRLDPFALPIARGYLGLAHYMLKDYETALTILQEFVSLAPNHQPGRLWLASTYARLGRTELARAEAAEVLRINPRWTIKQFEPLGPFKNPDDAHHFFEGMRMAGLPET